MGLVRVSGITVNVVVLAAAAVLLLGCSSGKVFTPEESAQLMAEANKQGLDPDYELSKKRIHPAAKELMKADFLWDILDDDSPFGNDDGADTLGAWRKWRRINAHRNPQDFVGEIFQSYGISFQDWSGKDGESLPLDTTGRLVTAMGDNTIIAIAFGQLMDEGYIEPTLTRLARKAISNEKKPGMYQRWRSPKERQERLTILESILGKAAQSPAEPVK